MSEKDFFFQAEDGIRDKLVTGVQTCALPISSADTVRTSMIPKRPRYPVIAQSGQPAARYNGVPFGIHFLRRSAGASIHTSLQVGQSFRISRCATTPRSAAAIL